MIVVAESVDIRDGVLTPWRIQGAVDTRLIILVVAYGGGYET